MFYGDSYKWFIGRVEDRNDPMQLGRVRVRVFGLHTEDQVLIPTNTLPWAPVLTTGSTNGVGTTSNRYQVGEHVMGFFTDGMSAQQPFVIGSFYGAGDMNLSAIDSDYREHTSFTEKNRLREGYDVPAGGGSPLYPYNKVTTTESGHVIEIDDTPDNTRLSTYHKSGTHTETYESGNQVTVINGKDYQIVLNGRDVHIKGDLNVNVDGNHSLNITGDYNVNVTGTHKVRAATSDKVYSSGEITVNGITHTKHTHPQNSGNHFGGGTSTSRPQG